MALVYTSTVRTIEGIRTVEYGTFAFDSSYPTGGEAWDPVANVGLNNIVSFTVSPTSGYVFQWDYTNKKLKAYYADYDAVADGALIEVANTTDLSSLTAVRVRIVGT